jgi:hypothetical protein
MSNSSSKVKAGTT